VGVSVALGDCVCVGLTVFVGVGVGLLEHAARASSSTAAATTTPHRSSPRRRAAPIFKPWLVGDMSMMFESPRRKTMNHPVAINPAASTNPNPRFDQARPARRRTPPARATHRTGVTRVAFSTI
jgi:hypothetical protein